jgi:lipopolysaccharide/colanic/teichoic acid biosynthesis glycosyltransferase
MFGMVAWAVSAAAQDDAEGTIGIDQRTHRIFDCAAAILGAMLFAPIILIVAIAIRLDSPGPIFIRELRFGHRNRVIQVFKFRLVSDCGVGGTGVRLTRVGRILSGTGIVHGRSPFQSVPQSPTE